MTTLGQHKSLPKNILSSSLLKSVSNQLGLGIILHELFFGLIPSTASKSAGSDYTLRTNE